MSTLVLFLPADAADRDGALRWLRVDGDAIVARGDGHRVDPEVALSDALPDLGEVVRVVGVVPASAVTLHWAELPDVAKAQTLAAARLLAVEHSLAAAEGLHVAVGREEEVDERPIAVVAPATMREWLAMLGARGFDPDALVPAPLLLPRPEEGYVRGDIAGEEVVRGHTSAWADEARITELLTDNVDPRTIGRDELDRGVAAAVASPVLDLRQGEFARRRRIGIDWPLVRRVARLAAVLLLATLAIQFVLILKLGFSADRLEEAADRVAREGLPPGSNAADPEAALEARLASLRGAGLGFTRTAAAVFAAVQQVPDSDVDALSFDASGALRVTLSTAGQGQAEAVKAAIESYGFQVTSGVFQETDGRPAGEFTVQPL